jgi:hypothetical protein
MAFHDLEVNIFLLHDELITIHFNSYAIWCIQLWRTDDQIQVCLWYPDAKVHLCSPFKVGCNGCLVSLNFCIAPYTACQLLFVDQLIVEVKCNGCLVSLNFCIAPYTACQLLFVDQLIVEVKCCWPAGYKAMYMKEEGSSYEIEIEINAWVSTTCFALVVAHLSTLEKTVAWKYNLYFHLNEGNGSVAGI